MSSATVQFISNFDVNIVMVWVILAKVKNIVNIEVESDGLKSVNFYSLIAIFH